MQVVDRPDPVLSGPQDVLLEVLRVGICGTDREEARGGRAQPPDGSSELVIGHEMLGRILAVGADVTQAKAGELAVCTVRRGCGECTPCALNRPDMCRTGNYKERGIWGLDGFQAHLVVENQANVIVVPPELEAIGVLTEPLSVAEKAIDEAWRLQAARMPDVGASPRWPSGRRCLVAGLGPVGLLAAMVLLLRGAEVYGLDVVDASSPRPQWFSDLGGHYIDGRDVHDGALLSSLGGPVELIVEAAGVPGLDFHLLDALGHSGMYVLTGIPGEDHPISISGGRLIRELVLDNQVMVGSVNASLDHFQAAVHDMGEAHIRWGSRIEDLISHRYPFTDVPGPFASHPPDEIKAVIEWGKT